MRNRVLIVSLLLAGIVSAAYATEFAIVVNPTNPARSVSLADLAKILKGKTAAWPTGKSITAVLGQPSSPALKFFRSNASAIGVVDVYNITGSVKVIKIDEKQPFDPGYALKGH